MSAEMHPENIENVEPEAKPLAAVPTEESDKRVSELMERVRKLDRQNTDLRKDIEKRDSGAKTVDERLAELERERDEARNKSRTVEAFADAGLGENWRKVFEEPDPFKRAEGVRSLLKETESNVAKKLATELGTAGTPAVGQSGKPQYTMDDLKDMSEAEINKAFAEGRVSGQK